LQHIPKGYNPAFILEDLDSLPRAELRKAQRTWAHQELANGILRSQLEWNGYKVVKVNARGTTHTCWKCGNPVQSQNNRKIICPTCYPKGLDRDLNGARNIARRYMLSGVGEHTCTPNGLDDPYKAMCKEAIIETKIEKGE
jgi:transposase